MSLVHLQFAFNVALLVGCSRHLVERNKHLKTHIYTYIDYSLSVTDLLEDFFSQQCSPQEICSQSLSGVS